MHIPRTDPDQWSRRLNAVLALCFLILSALCAFAASWRSW